jgi:hypothetical protein
MPNVHQRNVCQLSHLQQPHNIHTMHYIEVLKGCVRYLLHLATWEYGIPTLVHYLYIRAARHMAHYCEIRRKVVCRHLQAYTCVM